MFLLKPWYLAAIKMAAPHKPLGRRPVEIQALFIDWSKRSAVIATWFFFVSNSSLAQYLLMYNDGSIRGTSKKSLWTKPRYMLPSL